MLCYNILISDLKEIERQNSVLSILLIILTHGHFEPAYTKTPAILRICHYLRIVYFLK